TKRAAAIRKLTSRNLTFNAERTNANATVNAIRSSVAGTRTSSHGLNGAPRSGAMTRSAATETPKPTRFVRHGTMARSARGNHTLSVKPTPSTIELADVGVAPLK